MQKILERVKIQQEKMGYTDLIQYSEAHRVDYLRDISLALVKEVTEFLDEVPWKPWWEGDQAFNKFNATYEICDIIVFALVLYTTLDTEMPLEQAMENTLTKIDERIKTGYGQKEKQKCQS